MHTQKEALIILNCSKMTLSRYVKDKKLTRVKKGRRTFYDEHEIASLVKEIEDNKNKYRPDVPKREKKRIELPDEVREICKDVSSADSLTKIGYQYLTEVTEYLQNTNLYKDVDREILVQYALSVQNYYKYLYLATQENCIFKSDSGMVSLHPYFKVMQHHEKQMLVYMDRLGLNPLARQKMEIEEKRELSEMEKLIFDIS